MTSNDTPLDTLLSDLVSISRHYGADPEFALAGGGNTSVKTDDRLFVKASGHALATIDTDGFVEMDRAAMHELLRRNLSTDAMEREEQFKQAIMAARIHPAKGQRPSVESVLHNLLACRFIVHTHSTYINMITCSRDGETLAREVLGPDVLRIPYVDPGFILAKTLNDA